MPRRDYVNPVERITRPGRVSRPDFRLMVSSSADRSSASPLPLRSYTTADSIYVFVDNQLADITSVDFYLNGTFVRNELAAPFDYAGTAAGGDANPYSLSGLANGTQVISAVITSNGRQYTASATFTVSGAASNLLKWAPPSGYLSYPTFSPTQSNRTYNANGGDVRVIMPSYAINRYVQILNARNLVIIGGEIYKPTSQANCTSSYDVQEGYCFDIRGTTGTVHMEGLKIWGPGSGQCIFMQHADNKPNQDWRIQNCFLEAIEPVGSAGSHSDCIQAAGGPQYLRLHRVSFNAQGNAIQTQPWDNWASPSYRQPPTLHEFYDMDVVQRDQNLNCADHRPPGGGYALWKSSKGIASGINAYWPCHFSNCWIDVFNGPEETYWYSAYAHGVSTNPRWGGWRAPGTESWAGKITGDTSWGYGAPPAGRFVPPSSVGIGYVSPGYQ